MRRGIFVTLMFLEIIPWMTGCQSARQIAMPGDGAATGSVTLRKVRSCSGSTRGASP